MRSEIYGTPREDKRIDEADKKMIIKKNGNRVTEIAIKKRRIAVAA
jgi:hypothetical protein